MSIYLSIYLSIYIYIIVFFFHVKFRGCNWLVVVSGRATAWGIDCQRVSSAKTDNGLYPESTTIKQFLTNPLTKEPNSPWVVEKCPKAFAIPNLHLDSQEFPYLISSWSMLHALEWPTIKHLRGETLLFLEAHQESSSETPCPVALRVCGAPSRYPTATPPLVGEWEWVGNMGCLLDATMGGMSFSAQIEGIYPTSEGKACAKEIAACCNTPPAWHICHGLLGILHQSTLVMFGIFHDWTSLPQDDHRPEALRTSYLCIVPSIDRCLFWYIWEKCVIIQ